MLLTAGFVSSAQASVRADIQRQYHRWAKAALSNDVDTILSILAPDYTLHTYTGTTIARADYEASLRKRKAANKPATAYQTKINSVRVGGSTASVISDETSEAVSLDPITNKKVKLIHIHRYLDTWIRSGGLWRLRTTITQIESTTVLPS
jgi:ketosteroid isomerase-like protein